MPMCTPESVTGLIGPIVMTSVALMIFLLALFWMAAQFFKRPEYEGFVSIEIYQLVISILIFGTVFGASCFAAGMADSFSPGGRDQFEIGRQYLDYITNDVIMPNVAELESLKLYSQWMGDVKARWGPGVWSTIIPMFPTFILIERVVDFLLLFISPFISSLMAQMVVLEIIRGLALPFVLPAGVVLRIFPPTRDAGAFLIASAIGFDIIFPYTYVMHDHIVRTMVDLDSQNGQNTCDQFYNIVTSGSTTKSAAIMTQNGMIDFPSKICHPFSYLGYLLLQALFLPALSITLTVAFIKGTTKFISQKMG